MDGKSASLSLAYRPRVPTPIGAHEQSSGLSYQTNWTAPFQARAAGVGVSSARTDASAYEQMLSVTPAGSQPYDQSQLVHPDPSAFERFSAQTQGPMGMAPSYALAQSQLVTEPGSSAPGMMPAAAPVARPGQRSMHAPQSVTPQLLLRRRSATHSVGLTDASSGEVGKALSSISERVGGWNPSQSQGAPPARHHYLHVPRAVAQHQQPDLPLPSIPTADLATTNRPAIPATALSFIVASEPAPELAAGAPAGPQPELALFVRTPPDLTPTVARSAAVSYVPTAEPHMPTLQPQPGSNYSGPTQPSTGASTSPQSERAEMLMKVVALRWRLFAAMRKLRTYCGHTVSQSAHRQDSTSALPQSQPIPSTQPHPGPASIAKNEAPESSTYEAQLMPLTPKKVPIYVPTPVSLDFQPGIVDIWRLFALRPALPSAHPVFTIGTIEKSQGTSAITETSARVDGLPYHYTRFSVANDAVASQVNQVIAPPIRPDGMNSHHPSVFKLAPLPLLALKDLHVFLRALLSNLPKLAKERGLNFSLFLARAGLAYPLGSHHRASAKDSASPAKGTASPNSKLRVATSGLNWRYFQPDTLQELVRSVAAHQAELKSRRVQINELISSSSHSSEGLGDDLCDLNNILETWTSSSYCYETPAIEGADGDDSILLALELPFDSPDSTFKTLAHSYVVDSVVEDTVRYAEVISRSLHLNSIGESGNPRRSSQSPYEASQDTQVLTEMYLDQNTAVKLCQAHFIPQLKASLYRYFVNETIRRLRDLQAIFSAQLDSLEKSHVQIQKADSLDERDSVDSTLPTLPAPNFNDFSPDGSSSQLHSPSVTFVGSRGSPNRTPVASRIRPPPPPIGTVLAKFTIDSPPKPHTSPIATTGARSSEPSASVLRPEIPTVYRATFAHEVVEAAKRALPSTQLQRFKQMQFIQQTEQLKQLEVMKQAMTQQQHDKASAEAGSYQGSISHMGQEVAVDGTRLESSNSSDSASPSPQPLPGEQASISLRPVSVNTVEQTSARGDKPTTFVSSSPSSSPSPSLTRTSSRNVSSPTGQIESDARASATELHTVEAEHEDLAFSIQLIGQELPTGAELLVRSLDEAASNKGYPPPRTPLRNSGHNPTTGRPKTSPEAISQASARQTLASPTSGSKAKQFLEMSSASPSRRHSIALPPKSPESSRNGMTRHATSPTSPNSGRRMSQAEIRSKQREDMRRKREQQQQKSEKVPAKSPSHPPQQLSQHEPAKIRRTDTSSAATTEPNQEYTGNTAATYAEKLATGLNDTTFDWLDEDADLNAPLGVSETFGSPILDITADGQNGDQQLLPGGLDAVQEGVFESTATFNRESLVGHEGRTRRMSQLYTIDSDQ